MYMTDRWYVAAPHERTNPPLRGAYCRAIGAARVHGSLLSEFSHLLAIACIRAGCRRQSRTHGCAARRVAVATRFTSNARLDSWKGQRGSEPCRSSSSRRPLGHAPVDTIRLADECSRAH